MAQPKFVDIATAPLDRYRSILSEEEFAVVEQVAERAREEFAGRAIWHVSSTARGGGVAEILHSMLPYVRGAGVDTRWVVLRESDDFFLVTKRLHNHLHGDPGDGGSLGDAERLTYENALASSAAQLARLLQPGDVVYLHDPQTAGLVPAMKELGAKVIWRCHVGVDKPGRLVHDAWDFLRPYLASADTFIFSRRAYIWDGIDPDKVWLMPPSIDPFSPKNQDLDPGTVAAILQEIGILADSVEHAPVFMRGDGSPGRVERSGELLQEEPIPHDAKVVAQISRWDRLKDPHGLVECFAEYIDDPTVHLVVTGPETEAVSDDPEGAAVYGDVAETWRRLPDETRRRVHLVSLPMYDLDENGAMVNALQRGADVLVQKSIAEGFGLVVAEGMWKGKPFVGSRVGGIQDQIIDGESGVLIDDPHDLEAFGRAIRSLLDDPARAEALGQAARERVREHFLTVGRLIQYVELVASLAST
ncbi:MAG TPA: glycosyltransferase [Solirubrobacterales bacterium]